jgi:hypothetical protein
MPCYLEVTDAAAITLAQAREALATQGFAPQDEGSVMAAARVLRQLGNNADFLGDIILEELKSRHEDAQDDNAYGPQAILLGRAGRDCLLRANLWPSADEPMMRASGSAAFGYGLPHDHIFDFLTLGYFGPGYWSDCYEADYGTIAGYAGEPVALRAMGRHRLAPGRLQFYRAHVDVHAQMPPDSMSVSINILHTGAGQGWRDQYQFDIERGQITGQLAHGASEAFLRIAVGLCGAEAADLAECFARHHPSDRMRLHALDALASVADAAEREAIWARAAAGGSRMVAMEAAARRRALEQGASGGLRVSHP